jgi:hypothetical protein
VKYDNTGSLWLNSGLIYHTRIEAPRLYGTYPRSIEFQGQKRGMGEAWTISKIFVNTTIDPTSDMHKYKNDGVPVVHGGDDPNRQCLGSSNPFIDGAWNEMEAVVRGSDSSVHIVNGITVFRCTKLRWSDTNDPNDMRQMLGSGALGLQVEGDAPNYVAPISYKGYMIMELDSVSGKPVNAKPTTSLFEFDSKAGMKQNPNSNTAAKRAEHGQNLSYGANGRRITNFSPFFLLRSQ